jgi:glucose-1-phosphate thymidylyltransferase
MVGMKGIILAGGTGSRLHPLTLTISKQLLPVYDKPMIYYPLSVLLLAGIREILLITTPRDRAAFTGLLGDGSRLGCSFSYVEQPEPRGLAEALLLAEEFAEGSSVALILGDNLFYGSGFGKLLREQQVVEGAVIFAAPVKDPGRYGVVELDPEGRPISLREKPQDVTEGYAVPGLYFYDSSVFALARDLQPSPRGELEITDLNRKFLEAGRLRVEVFNRGIAWLDTGTFASLHDASMFVRVIEERQGRKIGCIEEVAFYSGFLGAEDLLRLAEEFPHSGYGEYLRQVALAPELRQRKV